MQARGLRTWEVAISFPEGAEVPVARSGIRRFAQHRDFFRVLLGRHDAAIACYEQALVLNAAFAEASHGLASTLQTLKQREGDPRAAAKGARDLLHYRQP
jgi:hypothetical protein